MFQWEEGQTSCLPCNDSYVTNEVGSVNEFQCVPHGEVYNFKVKCSPRGALKIFCVRGRAIGKGIDFLDICSYKERYRFSQFWCKGRYRFSKCGFKI